jgi:hypothetical protein
MKVEVLTNIRGAERWVKGMILESPLHPDIQSLLKKPGVLRILPESTPIPISIPKAETVVEKEIEKKEDPKILPVDKVEEKKVELKIGKKVPLLRKGKSKK